MNRPLAAVLPLIALFPTATVAQTPAPPMQRVEVTGNAALDARRNDSAGRITVGRDELLRYGDSTLSAVLKRQPGMSVVNGEIRMRGLGAGYTQILVNGEPMAQGFSIDSIAPALIDRIDIMRSGSAEFGTQAIAGTINVILKKAGAGTRQDLNLAAGLMPGRLDPAASLRVSGKRGALAWALSAEVSRLGGDYRSQVRETSTDAAGALSGERLIDEHNVTASTRFGLAPRLNWALPGGDSLEWQATLDRTRPGGHGGMRETVLLGAPTEYPDNSFAIRSTAHSERSDVTWNSTVGSGKLRVKAGINRNTRDNDYLFLGASSQATLARSVVSDVIDNTASLNGKYLAPLGQAHSLGLGWDLGRTSRSEFRLQRDTSFDGAPLGILDEDYQALITRSAVFAQDEWSVTPRLQVYLGMRWEGLRSATEGRMLDQVRSRSSVLSPLASVLWKVPGSDKDQLRMSLSRTYKAPTSRQLVPRRYTTNNDNSQVNPDVRGNPNLRPELAWGIDAGYERYFGKSGVFSLSGYGRKVDQVTVQTLYQENGAWLSTPFNNGKASVWGIEADTRLPVSAGVELHANAARNWSRLDAVPGPDNRLAEQVAATFNLGLDYAHSASLTVGANLNLQFSGRYRQSASLARYTGPARELGVYGVWKLDPATQLRLTCADVLAADNASNGVYHDQLGGTERATTVRGRALVRLVFEKKL